MKLNKKIYATCIAVALVTNSFVAATKVKAAESERIFGDDRYKTSVEISKSGWEKAECAVIASGESYADALCSIPLAKLCDGPVLLTNGSSLPQEVSEELKRLNVKKVFISGGNGAISKEVEEIIKGINNLNVERVCGEDRYATSVAIAKRVKELSSQKNQEVVFASGEGFADALAIASIAASKEMPIILSQNTELPEVVKNYLSKEKVTSSYVIGGEGMLSNKVKSLIDSELSVVSKRLGGKDRYETNIEILKEFKDSIKFDKIYVAVGDKYADALSVAVLAAKYNSPLILMSQSLSNETENYLKTVIKGNTKVVAIGGEAVVSNIIVDTIKKIVDIVKNTENTKDNNKKDNSNSDNHSSNKPNKPGKPDKKPETKTYGINPKIEVTENKALILIKNEANSKVKVTVYDGEGQLKYIEQENIVNGKCEFKAEFQCGNYTAKFKLDSQEAISVDFIVK